MKSVVIENGVGVRVFMGKGQLAVDSDGNIGIDGIGELTIRVEVDHSKRVGKPGRFACVERVGEVYATPIERTKLDDQKVFEKTMKITWNDKGKKFAAPKPPDNHMKLVMVMTDGTLKVWEIAIVRRHNGEFYLTVQMTWDVKCYVDESGKIVIPALSDWESLRKVVATMITADGLEDASNYRPEPAITADGFEENEGLVKWYNMAMGTGAVVTAKGEASIHWSKLSCKEEEMAKGVVVTFKNFAKKEGSSFKYEVTGVQPKTA